MARDGLFVVPYVFYHPYLIFCVAFFSGPQNVFTWKCLQISYSPLSLYGILFCIVHQIDSFFLIFGRKKKEIWLLVGCFWRSFPTDHKRGKWKWYVKKLFYFFFFVFKFSISFSNLKKRIKNWIMKNLKISIIGNTKVIFQISFLRLKQKKKKGWQNFYAQ